jgi:hypothetical protein
MTLEVTLLASMFALILGGAFFGESGPMRVFQDSGPRLGARIEKHLATGRNFLKDGAKNQWVAPASRPPTGEL